VPGWEATCAILSYYFTYSRKKTEQSKSGHPCANAAAMSETGSLGSTDHIQLLKLPPALSTQ